jgi:hypothetical protein
MFLGYAWGARLDMLPRETISEGGYLMMEPIRTSETTGSF